MDRLLHFCPAVLLIASRALSLAVSTEKVHAVHLEPSPRGLVGWKGFGHRGTFDAQIVVQCVEKVVAEDEFVIRKPPSKTQ